MAGHGEGHHRQLHEGQHSCQKHLGDIISFFFRFISGNLARGEGSSGGHGWHRKRLQAEDGTCLSGMGTARAVRWEQDLWDRRQPPSQCMANARPEGLEGRLGSSPSFVLPISVLGRSQVWGDATAGRFHSPLLLWLLHCPPRAAQNQDQGSTRGHRGGSCLW